jgi:lactate permease
MSFSSNPLLLIFSAALPIALILLLMAGFRWSAAKAGAAGYFSAILFAVFVYGATWKTLLYAHLRAVFLALDVLYIIWMAFLLYRVADEAGAIHAMGSALPRLTRDKGMQALLIGWVFASFLQGAGGFGVPVAVTAPLLVGLGFSPLSAVVIPTIGHGWAVGFGSLGTPFKALLATTGLSSDALAAPTALFTGTAGILTGFMVAHLADGWRGVKRLGGKILVIGLVMSSVTYLVATSGLWNIASFTGGLAGLLVSAPLAAHSPQKSLEGESSDRLPLKPLFVSFAAYETLLFFTAFVLLIPPVKEFLGQFVISISLPKTVTLTGYTTSASATKPIRVFAHTGAVLFYASLSAYWIYKKAGLYTPGAPKRIARSAVKKVWKSTLSITEIVMMAMVMQYAGMTETLARELAHAVGAAYPLLAPWVGALGAFMTGSNTNSNVVFAALQLRTAEILHYRVPILLAAQTAGAALASVIAPAKLVVGASTAGMDGKEGQVLRAALGYTLLLTFLVSIFSVLLA